MALLGPPGQPSSHVTQALNLSTHITSLALHLPGFAPHLGVNRGKFRSTSVLASTQMSEASFAYCFQELPRHVANVHSFPCLWRWPRHLSTTRQEGRQLTLATSSHGILKRCQACTSAPPPGPPGPGSCKETARMPGSPALLIPVQLAFGFGGGPVGAAGTAFKPCISGPQLVNSHYITCHASSRICSAPWVPSGQVLQHQRPGFHPNV